MSRLYRSQKNRMVSGVIGGIAEHFQQDPSVLRLLFVAGLFISAGTLIFLYVAAAVIIPSE